MSEEMKPNTSEAQRAEDYHFSSSTSVGEFVFHALITVISILWLFSNILNIMVFAKQGFNTSTTIALTSLAIVDIGNLIFSYAGMVLHVFAPWLAASPDVYFNPIDMAAFITFPHLMCVPIESWINVLMTTERCLCIALPLKIKQIINPRRTLISISVISVLIVSTAFWEYADVYLDWKFYPLVNRTLIGLTYRHSRDYIERPVYFSLDLVLLTSFPVLTLLTSILIYKLLVMSKWRKKSVTKKDQVESGELRDRTVIRLVVFVACFLIISLVPCVLLYSLSYTVPGFESFGKYQAPFILLAKISYFFDAVNSSFNIFIFYNMSSNFKQTFQQILKVSPKSL